MSEVNADNAVYTFTELQTFQDCEQLYQYNYEELIDPVYDGLPRPVGGAFHEGVAAVYNGEPRSAAIEAASEKYWKDLREYYQLPTTEPKRRKEIDNGWVQVRALLEKYPWLDIERVVAVEQTVEIDMGHGRRYRGKVDRLMVHNNDMWVHDTKTTGFDIDKALKVHRLRMQYVGYFKLAQHWLENTDAGAALIKEKGAVRLAGTMSDLVKKPRIYQRKDGTHTVSGDAFHREPMHVTEAQVKEFAGWFHKVVNNIEVARWAERQDHLHYKVADEHPKEGAIRLAPIREPWIKNTNHCLAFNRVCPFYSFCRMPGRRAQLVDGREFKIRETKHPEYA